MSTTNYKATKAIEDQLFHW